MDEFWIFGLINEIEQTDETMASTLWDLPFQASNRDYDGLEASFPVLLAYAREHKHPWMEMFIRHWRLQAYVTTGARVEELLPEAVNLVAMSARDEVRDCPESRCAAQDLSLCYGSIDGPGYAVERMALVQEMVDKVEPGTGCFTCFTSEKLDALCHLERFEEAMVYGEAAIARARDYGEPIDLTDHFWNKQARPLLRAAASLGRWEEVERMLARSAPDGLDDEVWRGAVRAGLAHGKGEGGADEVLPAIDAALGAEGLTQVYWLRQAGTLALAGVRANDAALGDAAETIAARALTDGRLREAFDSLLLGAELALARGDGEAARAMLDRAVALRPRLRGSHGADERLAQLGARTAA